MHSIQAIALKRFCTRSRQVVFNHWGDETVIKDFNEKAFINANSKTIEQVITEVMEIENDHEKWQKMVSQPVFNDSVNEKYKNELIRGFSRLF